jgi:hypothetical protein
MKIIIKDVETELSIVKVGHILTYGFGHGVAPNVHLI